MAEDSESSQMRYWHDLHCYVVVVVGFLPCNAVRLSCSISSKPKTHTDRHTPTTLFRQVNTGQENVQMLYIRCRLIVFVFTDKWSNSVSVWRLSILWVRGQVAVTLHLTPEWQITTNWVCHNMTHEIPIMILRVIFLNFLLKVIKHISTLMDATFVFNKLIKHLFEPYRTTDSGTQLYLIMRTESLSFEECYKAV